MSRVGNRGELEALVRSVETGSFSAAARELRLTPSAVSKLVTRLERYLGVRLVARSTRHVVATPEGERFVERARRILADMEEAERDARRARERPSGRLRLHMGLGFGLSQGVDALPRFLEKHRDVELDLILGDRRVDLAVENIDISTWSFPPWGAGIVTRKMFEYDRVLVASPAYLRSRGVPRDLEELARHQCLVVSGVPRQSPWYFKAPKGRREFEVPVAHAVNNAIAKYRLVLQGAGIAQFSEYVVAEAVRDGALVRVLPEIHDADPLVQYAVYRKDRLQLPRVSAMLAFLVETFAGRPWRK